MSYKIFLAITLLLLLALVPFARADGYHYNNIAVGYSIPTA